MEPKQEQLLELKQKQLEQQVNREARVGLSLQRLKESRREIDNYLEQTVDFNNRVNDP